MRTFQNISQGFEVSNMIQPSLEIGKENDEHEREADSVADKVMKMSDSSESLQKMPYKEAEKMNEGGDTIQMMVDSPLKVHTKCENCKEEEENKIQKKTDDKSCPETVTDCEPCNNIEDHWACRIPEGKTTGYLGWACQNKNPGNIRPGETREATISAGGGPAPCGSNGYAGSKYMVFTDYPTGRQALEAYVKGIMAGAHPAYWEVKKNGDITIKEFFSHYAPASDKNNPVSYAESVATHIGETVNSKMSVVAASKLSGFCDAIENKEGWFEKGSTTARKR